MRSILILTQYYPPETGAPQNRLSSLARNLQQAGMKVSVLTAMPNYPKMEIMPEYKGRWYCYEKGDNQVEVHRSWIYVRKSKAIVPRLLNYFSFVFSSLFSGLFRIRKHDIILCESPPLFLGITALLLKWMKGSKLVFNVSDLWPESAEKLGIINNRSILALTEKLEKHIYRKSDMVSGQTQGIVKNIAERVPGKKMFWLRNGVDLSQFNKESVTYNWRQKNQYNEQDFIVMYGGVLGHAQGLEVIIKAAALLKELSRLKFVIIGDGPEKPMLEKMIAEQGLNNILLLPNQPGKEMPNLINACDAAVIPLKNLELFRGAIPSKIFEYLIFKKPILLGVDGEARELFIDQGNCGLFYTPENENELAAAITRLLNEEGLQQQLGSNGELYVRQRFNRQSIAAEFHKELNELFVI